MSLLERRQMDSRVGLLLNIAAIYLAKSNMLCVCAQYDLALCFRSAAAAVLDDYSPGIFFTPCMAVSSQESAIKHNKQITSNHLI